MKRYHSHQSPPTRWRRGGSLEKVIRGGGGANKRRPHSKLQKLKTICFVFLFCSASANGVLCFENPSARYDIRCFYDHTHNPPTWFVFFFLSLFAEGGREGERKKTKKGFEKRYRNRRRDVFELRKLGLYMLVNTPLFFLSITQFQRAGHS